MKPPDLGRLKDLMNNRYPGPGLKIEDLKPILEELIATVEYQQDIDKRLRKR